MHHFEVTVLSTQACLLKSAIRRMAFVSRLAQQQFSSGDCKPKLINLVNLTLLAERFLFSSVQFCVMPVHASLAL